jgi:serine/threonine-protein phosphatase 2A regulatory subunit B''
MPQHGFAKGPLLSTSQIHHESIKLENIMSNKVLLTDADIRYLFQTIGLPKFCARPLIDKLNGVNEEYIDYTKRRTEVEEYAKAISSEVFRKFWEENLKYYDNVRRVFNIIRHPSRDYIIPNDFEPIFKEILNTHPGLAPLKSAPEYQNRYKEATIARIFYTVSRSWRNRITLSDLRAKKAHFVESFLALEKHNDILTKPEPFDYMSYYIILCKFCELDTDRDQRISKDELLRYSNFSLTTRIVDRIFEVCRFSYPGAPGHKTNKNYFGFADFAWFLMSEEDKTTDAAINMWFKCIDINGQHYLTPADLYYFYEEQMDKMELSGMEIIPYQQAHVQILDMLHPQDESRITLEDIKKSGVASMFFNLLFNANKFLEEESRFATRAKRNGGFSDWMRFASKQYELALQIDRAEHAAKQKHNARSFQEAVNAEGLAPHMEYDENSDSDEDMETLAGEYDDDSGDEDYNVMRGDR